jgi:putative tryptophan/tyrosine transport system substrate-binding protein
MAKGTMKWLAIVLLVFSLLPGAASAQEAKRRVAFLAFNPLPAYEASFNNTLRRLGWEEGRNLVVERRYIHGGAPLPDVAAELVRQTPDVIVSPSAGITTVVRRETTTIPIVVLAAGELVGAGLAESLARPGGNVTGTQIVQRDLMGKRLQLLREALPRLKRVAALQDSATVPPAMRVDSRKAFEGPARALQMEPLWYEVQSVGELDDRFRTMAQEAHAVIVLGSPFTFQNARLIAEVSARYRIPATYEAKDFVQAGGLMPYGVDFDDLFVRGAVFVDKILRGAKPGLLPIEQPTKFEFVINLKTAKALGLTIPPSLLARADQVIE